MGVYKISGSYFLIILLLTLTFDVSLGQSEVPTILPTTENPTKIPTPAPTADPTISPTKAPTIAPTDSPTKFPTVSPTSSPTKSPTKSPTASPTKSPTASPTKSPTKAPTNVPTASPTKSPTESPTKSPTASPTKSPTESPTKSPTESPTKNPTNSPTKSPTEAPTKSPTPYPSASPSVSPTSSPSSSPTFLPTAVPSNSPTSFPSQVPSSTPTSRPTVTPGNPTIAPSEKPTNIPSFVPSDGPSATPSMSQFPSASPTNVPSVSPAPSRTPSASPTSAPSSNPSLAPSLSTQRFLVKGVTLLNDVEELEGESIFAYQKVTEDTIFRELATVTPDELQNLQVDTSLKNQQRIRDPNENNGSRRFLQFASALRVEFETLVKFQSTKMYDDSDIDILAAEAFNSPEDREQYIKDLQREDTVNAFEDLVEIAVEIGGIQITDAPTPAPAEESEFPIVVVAASAGGAAVLLIGCFLYFTRCRDRQPDKTFQRTDAPAGPDRVSSNIFVEPQDEVSTLGDPMYAPTGGMLMAGLEKDETVSPSIVSGDYDYARAYGDNQTTPSISTATIDKMISSNPDDQTSGRDSTSLPFQADNSLFSDDSSFEQQFHEPETRFQVDAPAGKLGVVIDTPSGGVPVVHAIKDSSVLAGSVKVGDRLISVDDEDTTALTAMQVSKLISSKSSQPARTLVFMRSRTKGSS